MPKTKQRRAASKSKMARSRKEPTSRRRSQREGMAAPEQLFKHELKDIYTGEHLLLDALETLGSESTLPDLAQAFADHRRETEQHIQRLEEVAEMIGEEIEQERCPGIEGLLEEKELFAQEKPTAEILTIFNIGAGEKTERYEITHYEGMIDLAHKLRYEDAVPLLEQNLHEEQAALEKLKGFADKVPMPEMAEAPA